MSNRDQFINAFRGETLGEINSQTSDEELFQNQSLRPILKLQNDLYIEIFKFYIIIGKSSFNVMQIFANLKIIG